MQLRVKICGITSVADAEAAVEAGADAIGLNFFRGSPRCIDIADAQQISDAVGDRIERVGVFVNASADEIENICSRVGLHVVQLHGDEPPPLLGQLYGGRLDDGLQEDASIPLSRSLTGTGRGFVKPLQIVRARRLGADGMESIRADLLACQEVCGRSPDAILVDAATAGAYGGTGQTADWDHIAGCREWLGDVPLVLAGGLTPENVAEAIRTVQPRTVDVASGVESSAGKKDRAKMRDFVAAALAAFS